MSFYDAKMFVVGSSATSSEMTFSESSKSGGSSSIDVDCDRSILFVDVVRGT